MTEPPVAPPPTPNETGDQPPLPVKRQRSSLPWILAAIAVVALLIAAAGVTAAVMSGREAKAPTAGATEQEALPDVQSETLPDVQPEPTTGPTPAASDFTLTPKITSKDCFGSAGCLVDFEVDVTYSGPTLSDTETWRVTYEVSGVEDGPQIGNLEVTGTQVSGYPESGQTPKSSTKLKIKVTDVEKMG